MPLIVNAYGQPVNGGYFPGGQPDHIIEGLSRTILASMAFRCQDKLAILQLWMMFNGRSSSPVFSRLCPEIASPENCTLITEN